MNQRKECW